jgi:hypothetical protein
VGFPLVTARWDMTHNVTCRLGGINHVLNKDLLANSLISQIVF